jgi:membrane associated rhomboid family serine protease
LISRYIVDETDVEPRAGIRRAPWLTVLVVAVTTAGLLVQETVSGTLEHLERSPAAWHGEWWRWGTALVTQDGHVPGGVFNIAGLLLVGAAAEQVVGRRAWLSAYVGAGLVGQVIGHWWQPVGAGNSVAICGLAAVLGVHLVRHSSARTALGVWTPVMWCAALASSGWAPMLYVGIAACLVAAGPLSRRSWTAYVATTSIVASTVVLVADRDIHGGTLAVALVVAGLVRPGVARLARRAARPGR